MRDCIFLKRGSATPSITRITPRISTTASASTQAIEVDLRSAMTVPPMPMMGA